MQEIHIPDEETLKKKIEQIKSDGVNELHIVADFDRTLTKAFVEGQKTHTGIAQIREGKYLTEDYAPRAHALFDKYHPIEISDSIPPEEKNKKMTEWWSKHQELLVECGMDMSIISDIIKKKRIHLREGVLEFLDNLHDGSIPFVIFSAGIGELIEKLFKSEGKLYNNIHVISNFFKFNKEGKVIGYKDKIIHVFNKNEGQLKDSPYYEKVKDRKNVILLGDGLGDLGMIEGLEHDNVIKIGFLNENVDEKLRLYSRKFDVVILHDGTFDYVNELLKKIL